MANENYEAIEFGQSLECEMYHNAHVFDDGTYEIEDSFIFPICLLEPYGRGGKNAFRLRKRGMQAAIDEKRPEKSNDTKFRLDAYKAVTKHLSQRQKDALRYGVYTDESLEKEARRRMLEAQRVKRARQKRHDERAQRIDRVKRLEEIGIPIKPVVDRIKNEELDNLLAVLEERLIK